jgi:hypothetical protein
MHGQQLVMANSNPVYIYIYTPCDSAIVNNTTKFSKGFSSATNKVFMCIASYLISNKIEIYLLDDFQK